LNNLNLKGRFEISSHLIKMYMKKYMKIVLFTALLVIAPLLMFAQVPPHPNGGNVPGPGNTPVGGPSGVPVGSGLYILLAMGAAYGMRRIYQVRSSTSVTE
jgi:hypothetical protein